MAWPLPALTTEWVYHKTADGLHPDGKGQQLLWLMNRARANPANEGLFLANSGDGDINFGISWFQVDTALFIREFAAIATIAPKAPAPKPPAAFARRLRPPPPSPIPRT
jgi:hypothetical protein